MAETEAIGMEPPAKRLRTSQSPQPEQSETALIITTSDSAVVTTNAEGKKVKKVIKKKRRPARPQVDAATLKSEPPPQTGTIFNIWYNKWSGGDREDKYLSKTHAPNRCSIREDSGYTRADSVPGSYFCLYFARGICPRGRDCEYLHRLPSQYDIYSGNVDCFGRDKHSDYRDDMGGVGSFMRQNRTLYVGRIHPTDDIEEIVSRHFQEWGQIERIRVLPARGVAFVTYTTEALAQFAKEAMAHQSLDNNEILNVRWATSDPNPVAQKREVKAIEEQAAAAIRKALPASFVKEIEGRDPDSKRRRLEEGSFGLDGYQAPDNVWFTSEKARLTMEKQKTASQIQASERAGLIKDENEDDDEEEEAPLFQSNQKSNHNGGLLSASTIAALNKFKPTSGSMAATLKPHRVTSGPLVAYDSDSGDDA